MNFIKVKKFFKSWGLVPSGDSINVKCFHRLLKEAKKKYNIEFANFCNYAIADDKDDYFYISAETWDDLNKLFIAFSERNLNKESVGV